MAVVITGNDGLVDLPSGHGSTTAEGALYGWRARFVNTITEVTGFTGQTNLRRNRGGLISVEGSAFGQPYDTGTPVVTAMRSAPAGTSMILKARSTTNTWTFTAIVSAISYETNKRDNTAMITFDFVGGDADDFTEVWTA